MSPRARGALFCLVLVAVCLWLWEKRSMATTVEFRTVPLPSPSMTTQVSQTPTSSPSLPFLPSPAAVVMRDAVFEQFTRCAPGFQMRESESEKACIRSSRLFRRGAFGSAAAFLWSGDVGYWTNGPACATGFKSEQRQPFRFCTIQVDFISLPFRRRLEPVWHAGADSLTVGYKLLAQPEAVFECPPTFRNQVGLCEAGEPALLSASAFRDTPTIETMFQQRLAHFAVDGRVYLSPATFEYVEHAAAWWQNMTDMHMAAGVVVVAMDAGTFTYLDHRNISVALLETVLPLQPCCLARLHMVAWRATNDVKVRSILLALRAGLEVIMSDMDVTPGVSAQRFESQQFRESDLVYFLQPNRVMSFMWSFMKPHRALMDALAEVLEQVATGGWDQDQFDYWMRRQFSAIVSSETQDLIRDQNNNGGILVARLAASSLVIPSPLFLVWAPSSPCFSVTNWSDALQQCMSTALVIARATGRLFVPDPRVGNAVDLVALQRWFPLHINAYFLYDFIKLPSQTTSGIDMETLGSVNSVVLQLTQAPSDYADFIPSTAFDVQFKLFYMPAAPGRPDFPCLRLAGPVSATNRIPVCKPIT